MQKIPPYDPLDLYQGGILSLEAQDFLLARYPQLSDLKSSALLRLNTSRYEHTLRLLNSFYQLLQDDYPAFRHLDSQARNKGMHPIDHLQFMDLRELTLTHTRTAADRHYFFLLLLSHDYGAIFGNSRHFVRSGKLCQEDFILDGYDNNRVELAGLLNGNHSYLGDLFLGEGTISYGQALLITVKTKNLDINRFWDLLYLLNALDIHGTLDGFLSKEKYDYLHQIKKHADLGHLGTNWAELRFKHLINDDTFYPRNRRQLPESTGTLYFQYFWYLSHQLSEAELMNILNLCHRLDLARINGNLDPFQFFTFSGDSQEDIPGIKKLATHPIAICFLGTDSGTVGSTPFQITPDGYLEFKLT